jgi:hypothetical protein
MPPAKAGLAVSRDANSPSPAKTNLDPSRAVLFDEFGELDSQLAEFDRLHPNLKKQIRRREELRGKILALYPDLPGDQESVAHGTDWDVHISACDNRREVTVDGKRKLSRLWGMAGFFQRCKIELGQLDSIPKTEHGLYLVESRSGPRHLKATPRVAKAA